MESLEIESEFGRRVSRDSMEKLPLEISGDIFSSLPLVSRLQCRDVCNTWRTVLPKRKMGLLYGVSHLKATTQFYFSERTSYEVNTKHGGDDDDYFRILTKTNHSLIMPPSICTIYMVGSCNGLVCFAGQDKKQCETKVYVCNPVIEEHFELPAITTYNKWAKTMLGFGYIRSSNKYKFVSIVRESSSKSGEVRVCTLRGGRGTGWSSKTSMFKRDLMTCLDDLSPPPDVLAPQLGVLADGALNWIGQSGKKPYILAFDLEHETFELLRSIPFVVCDTNRAGLMELEGNLCVPEIAPTKNITIWELRYRKTIKYTRKHKADHSYWLKKFRLAWDDYSYSEPFALTDGDKCLFWYNVILTCYDPETKTFREPVEILQKLWDEEFMKRLYTTTRATSHVNTLASCSGGNTKGKLTAASSTRETAFP